MQWKYAEPKDLHATIVDKQGRTWRFCTKCKCRNTQRVGMYVNMQRGTGEVFTQSHELNIRILMKQLEL